MGGAQSFLPGKDASDEHGHGTLVAGLGLYGDIESAIQNGQLTPKLRIFSGRILDETNENQTGFVEKQIDEAVKYFHESNIDIGTCCPVTQLPGHMLVGNGQKTAGPAAWIIDCLTGLWIHRMHLARITSRGVKKLPPVGIFLPIFSSRSS